MKKQTNRNINNTRYDLLIKTIERYERFQYVDLDIEWCCNTITWLWKWRKISAEEKDSLCDRMIAIMQIYSKENLYN